MYRYILKESCSRFDLTCPPHILSFKTSISLHREGECLLFFKLSSFCSRWLTSVFHLIAAPKFDAFAKGFRDLCEGPALALFRPWELQLLICGSPHLDFCALEKAARYQDGFEEKSPIITQLWEIVHEVRSRPRRGPRFLLSFLVSCSLRFELVSVLALSFSPIYIYPNYIIPALLLLLRALLCGNATSPPLPA